VSDNARALFTALRAAYGMHREIVGILSARGRILDFALHGASPETIAAARELGGKHVAARIASTPDGWCYDEVHVTIDGTEISIFGDERPAVDGEEARS